jgi:hypothetical protein
MHSDEDTSSLTAGPKLASFSGLNFGLIDQNSGDECLFGSGVMEVTG